MGQIAPRYSKNPSSTGIKQPSGGFNPGQMLGDLWEGYKGLWRNAGLDKPIGQGTANQVRQGAMGAAQQRGNNYIRNRYGMEP